MVNFNDEEKEEVAPTPVVAPVEEKKEQQPIINFNPEFNFGSKNKNDNDTVHGILNQDGTMSIPTSETKKYLGESNSNVQEADYYEEEYNNNTEEISKTDIIQTLEEALETKDPTRLKEMLNKERKRMDSEKNQNLSRSDKNREEEWYDDEY